MILVGTSGYDYPEWRGNFYPLDLRREQFLEYYATQFNAVELNFTFYHMPAYSIMESFYNRTKGKLSFSLKATRSFTHEIDRSWKDQAKEFKDAVQPIHSHALLSALLFQFPQSFRYTVENRYYLRDMIKEFEGFPVVIEFRHKEWLRPSVFEGLSSLRADIVFCDMPALSALPDGLTYRTPFIGYNAYVRLHGRNSNAWYAFDSRNNGAQRYEYQYTQDELEEFVPVVDQAYEEGRKVQIYFNNHPKGYGAKNARQFRDLLDQDKYKSVIYGSWQEKFHDKTDPSVRNWIK